MCRDLPILELNPTTVGVHLKPFHTCSENLLLLKDILNQVHKLLLKMVKLTLDLESDQQKY